MNFYHQFNMDQKRKSLKIYFFGKFVFVLFFVPGLTLKYEICRDEKNQKVSENQRFKRNVQFSSVDDDLPT